MVLNGLRHSGQFGGSGRIQVHMASTVHCRQKRSWRQGSSWKLASRVMQMMQRLSASSSVSPVVDDVGDVGVALRVEGVPGDSGAQSSPDIGLHAHSSL
jgi:hypothetical protein